jgi:hypothetical protein
MTDTNGKPELIFSRGGWYCAVCGEFVPGNVANHVHNSVAEINELRSEIAQLNKQNRQLTDALYREALRSVDAFALMLKVLEADEQDRWDALDLEPFVKWIEAFPKPPIISVTPTK